MARFIMTHPSAAEATQEQFMEAARSVMALLAPGVEWLNSWWFPSTGRLLCEWEAPDEDTVRASLGPALELFPIETIDEVQWADPQRYK